MTIIWNDVDTSDDLNPDRQVHLNPEEVAALLRWAVSDVVATLGSLTDGDGDPE